jgi:hypothetical protein
LPLTEVSPQPSAIPGGNPPGDRQSAVGWGNAGFEPGTAGQQSGTLNSTLNIFPFMFSQRVLYKIYKFIEVFLTFFVSAAPATVDFLVQLDKDFAAIVTNMVCPTSKEVIVTGKKLSTMAPADAKRVRNEILHLVYGKKNVANIL